MYTKSDTAKKNFAVSLFRLHCLHAVIDAAYCYRCHM